MKVDKRTLADRAAAVAAADDRTDRRQARAS
jgi:hypothetical protein